MKSIDEVTILNAIAKSTQKWVMFIETTETDDIYDPRTILRQAPCVKAHSHVALVSHGVGYGTFDTKEALEEAFSKLEPKTIRALGCDPILGVYLDTENQKP